MKTSREKLQEREMKTYLKLEKAYKKWDTVTFVTKDHPLFLELCKRHAEWKELMLKLKGII